MLPLRRRLRDSAGAGISPTNSPSTKTATRRSRYCSSNEDRHHFSDGGEHRVGDVDRQWGRSCARCGEIEGHERRVVRHRQPCSSTSEPFIETGELPFELRDPLVGLLHPAFELHEATGHRWTAVRRRG
jgi:hypothetical protein